MGRNRKYESDIQLIKLVESCNITPDPNKSIVLPDTFTVENSKINQKKLPIGYWLKRADTLLTEGIDAIQSELGINRTQWQMINSMAETPGIGKGTLAELMKPFVNDDQLSAFLEELSTAGIISGAEVFHLTEKGRQLHAECLNKQKGFREKAMLGISREEYELTLTTLEKIVNNLA